MNTELILHIMGIVGPIVVTMIGAAWKVVMTLNEMKVEIRAGLSRDRALHTALKGVRGQVKKHEDHHAEHFKEHAKHRTRLGILESHLQPHRQKAAGDSDILRESK